MALKQTVAVEALKQVAGEIVGNSLCEITNGWLALVQTESGKKLATAVKGENPLRRRQPEKSEKIKGVDVDIMPLTPINALEVRHALKWTAPMTCGTKGTSIGFSNYLNMNPAFLADIFAKKQIRPVLVDLTSEAGAAVGLDIVNALDTATWGILEAGNREGYGALAAELKIKAENFAGFNFDEEIYKALMYGYNSIGLDCSDKIDLGIEKLTDEQVEKRFEQFNDVFRAAVDASYLKVEFKVGENKVSFQPAELHRIVLEYGEAIMHIQNVYKTFLKSAPWDIDFEIAISKPGKTLTPQEHCLIANELQRNDIKVAALCMDAACDTQLNDNIAIHADIAGTYGYRLSIKNADIALVSPAAVMKATKGKVHFKLNNIMWMSAVKYIAANNAELHAKIAAAIASEVKAGEAICGTPACKEFAQGYAKALAVGTELAAEIKTYIMNNKDEYEAAVKQNLTECFLKRM